MRISKTSMILTASLMALVPAQASAQHLAGMIKHLFDVGSFNAPAGTVNHASHFFLGGEALTKATRQLNVSLAEQLTSFPIASSSGGFTFAVNERGEVVPTSSTFGPLFAERGVTIGRNKFNFGFSFQATSYDAFEGLDLESGEIRFISEHNNCCPAGAGSPSQTTDFNPEFERDLLSSRLRAEIDTRTTAFFANYGVTNRFDIGVAVPIVNVEIDATVDGEILRTATGAATTHSFDATGARTASFSDSGSASGLGDVLVRAKYNLFRTDTAAFAAALDLRLPTGDKDNLLGTGATQTQVFFIGSAEYGRFSPHVNFGYTFSNGETSAEAGSATTADVATLALPVAVDPDPVDLSVPDEINYTAGFSVAAGPRVTLGFDMRGRTIRNVPRFGLGTTTYANRGPGP
ncbi:MAG TPA: transporter, partial [Rhodothermia bacterium]|nr:transporter [Rhodothermia bacterium]